MGGTKLLPETLKCYKIDCIFDQRFTVPNALLLSLCCFNTLFRRKSGCRERGETSAIKRYATNTLKEKLWVPSKVVCII